MYQGSINSRVEQRDDAVWEKVSFSPIDKQNGSVNFGYNDPELTLPFFFCSGYILR